MEYYFVKNDKTVDALIWLNYRLIKIPPGHTLSYSYDKKNQLNFFIWCHDYDIQEKKFKDWNKEGF